MQEVRPAWPRRGVWVGGLICLAAFLAMAIVNRTEGTLRDETTPLSIGLFLAAFAGFFLAAWGNEHEDIPTRWLWVIPIIFRLLLLTTTPTLSDDVYRYLWDGHVFSQGVNPYSYAISDSALDGYEIPARQLANNPDLSSPYLPTAQLVFAAAAVTLPSKPVVLQIVMVGFDLAAALLIAKLLTISGLPRRRLLLYLWNPLVIVEFAHGAHLDALMIMLALLAVWAALSRPSPGATAAAGESTPGRAQEALSPIALALATMTRPIPLLLLPVLWWRWGSRQRILYVASSLALLLPFGFGKSGFGIIGEPSGSGLFGSARIYARDFRFNAGVANWLEGFSPTVADVVTALVMGTSMIGVLRLARRSDPRTSLRLLPVPLMAYVVLTPVLHPWYATVLIAFLPFMAPAGRDDGGERPDRWLLLTPWLCLACLLPLSYITYRDPAFFHELAWVRKVEWLPTIGLLALTTGLYHRGRLGGARSDRSIRAR